MRQSYPAPIQWLFPKPRDGVIGAVDRFIGPGATKAEVSLQLSFPLAAAVIAPLYATTAGVDWDWYQYLVTAILALDMVGGVITNATASAKRWYHRPDQEMSRHMRFVSSHYFHLGLVAWVFLNGDVYWALIAASYLTAASVSILSAPVYLQRPVSLSAYLIALLIALYGLAQPHGLEWFLPLFYLKLLVSHLPVEAPFRPRS